MDRRAMVDVDNDTPPQSLTSGPSARVHMLLVRASHWVCALPITDVLETMRALPIRPVAGTPVFVRGLSIIRGKPVPVLDVGALMGAACDASGGRFVTMRAGDRSIALYVDEVIGTKFIDTSALAPTPPLLAEALPGYADKLLVLDGQVIATLRAGRILPDAVWEKLLREESG